MDSKIYYLYLLIPLFFYQNLYAQKKKDILKASNYYEQGQEFSKEKPDTAHIYFQKALEIYHKAKNWERVLDCHNQILVNFILAGNRSLYATYSP